MGDLNCRTNLVIEEGSHIPLNDLEVFPSPCKGPVLGRSQDKGYNDCAEHLLGGATDCHTGTKCRCYLQQTLQTPCVSLAPLLSIRQGTTISDQLFINKGAGWVGGCSPIFTYNIDSNVPGSYSYTVSCTNGPCTSQTMGKVIIDANPLLTISTLDTQLNCSGCTTLKATVTSGSPGPFCYPWPNSGGAIAGATSATYSACLADTYYLKLAIQLASMSARTRILDLVRVHASIRKLRIQRLGDY